MPLLLLALSLFSTHLWAQTLAEITGQVFDSSGASVSGATLTITNTGTNAARTVVTNSAGVYTAPSLVPGSYAVRAEMAGFRPVLRSGIELHVQQTARIDFTLELGQLTEAIQVTGGAPLLNTENATVGTVVENRRIVELPLNGRNFLQLLSLSPNVTAGFANSGQMLGRQGGQRAEQNISVAGQRSEYNNFTLDGVSNTDPNFNTYVFLPSIDALQEFKVQTGIYPAEFGRNTSQINVSTKPGGNQFHGALFHFHRNENLDATNYAFTVARPPREPFVRNQYGFTLGGPVWIPKLYNGRNRLFFMANFEGLRDRKGLRRLADVPSVAMRQGDFSSVTGTARLFDPDTRVRQADGRIAALPFAGNLIPQTRFNSRALKLLEFYPAPNVPGAGLSRNYEATEGRTLDNDQFSLRMDFAESANSNWFGRFSTGDELQISPATFPRQGFKLDTTVKQAMITNTRILSPSLVNEFRFGYSRFLNGNLQYNAFTRDVITEIGGIPGVAPQAPEIWGTPSISITGFSGFGESSLAPFINRNHTFQWVDNLSVIRGTHSLRFGAEIRRDRYNTRGNQHPRGSFSFQGQATQNPLALAGTGYGFADYMLGHVRFDDGALGLAITLLRNTSQAYYIDDTWKIRSNLTLSFGLRYEYTPPYSDKFQNLINVEIPSVDDPARRPTLVRAGAGDFYEGYQFRFNPAIQTARDGRMGSRLLQPDRNDFAPRLGLAFSPTRAWTIRAGFGVFYAQDIGNTHFDLGRNVAARRQDTSNNDFPDLTLDRPFRGIGETLLVNNPLVLSIQEDRRTAYVLQYLLNVQRQIGQNLVIEAGYTGNQGHKLARHSPLNFPRPGPGNVQTRRPFPEQGILQHTVSVINANYHAATLKLQRNFSAGLTYLVSYTFSKAIDTGSSIRNHDTEPPFPQDVYNIRGERALSNFHQGQRLATSLLWEPPVGKGKAFLNQGGIPNQILGGWQLGSILTLRSGMPFTVMSSVDSANIGWASQRPNATGAPIAPPAGRDPQEFFNRAAFAPLAPFTYGNVGRNTVSGPELVSWDFSAMKRFRFPWEGHELQFRFESFNFPNRPNFGFPNASLQSTSFARISATATTMRENQFALKYVF